VRGAGHAEAVEVGAGPPVCIISIAQQASPNIMYQTDDFRVQLRKSSTWW